VAKRVSRISNAGSKTSAVAKSVAKGSGAAHTFAPSLATVKVSAKMQAVVHASNLAVNRKRLATILTKPFVTHLLRAKKRSLARTRFSSLANVKHKSRRCDAMRPNQVRVT
jgi:hypothetical protein